MTDEYEDLRRKYKPDRIRVLFVGESRPASGRFFYKGNTVLYRATQQAFRAVYDRDWRNATDFLDFFRCRGCYLDDLYPEPIGQADEADCQRRCREAVSGLAERMKQWAPQAVIAVLLRIEECVSQGMSAAGLRVPFYCLPFPARWYRRYVEELIAALRELRDGGILDC